MRLLPGAVVFDPLDFLFVLAQRPVEFGRQVLFRESINGIWLASPVQVYLDLMGSEGRAREMAKHLRQERIGF